MDNEQVREIIMQELLRDVRVFQPINPEVEIFRDWSSDHRTFWPDLNMKADGLIVRAYLHYFREQDNKTTSIEFYYRNLPKPAMMTYWLSLIPELQNRGLGNQLVVKMQNIAQQLDCADRIYVKGVTNPGFWERNGYAPIKSFSKYWQKVR